jgi:hypothetical protein
MEASMRASPLTHALTAALIALFPFPAAGADDVPHMGTTMTIKGRPYDVFIENDVNARTPSFNRDIKAHGLKGRIVSCALLIDLPVGVVGGNHSYGGYCKLVDDHGARSQIAICNDDKSGHFKLERADAAADWSEDALAEFVARNCYGG